jgi:hypothetical protein
VGQDQLIGRTWPDDFPQVTCLDWQSGQPNAKYWVTHLLATTVGTPVTKAIVASTTTDPAALYVMPYYPAVDPSEQGGAEDGVQAAGQAVLGHVSGALLDSDADAVKTGHNATGKRGLLVVNKTPEHMVVKIEPRFEHGTVATCVEASVGVHEPGFEPPIVKQLKVSTNSSVFEIGGFGVCVISQPLA